ncbi:manganese ABC transporter, inner membrane permease protein SitD [Klebsiella pneumoniae subsp. rhinoscleromatis]|nr:manganese ABC transporter, inner membrane permease protein SitD [Klebsiella pneumoniae subsp. rhinoscleromatis]
MSWLLEPFGYHYMLNAMWVSALVGGVCAFLSCYLMLKGWSLIGDALSHSIVPGVAGAYMLGLPFALGAFLSGGLAAGSMLFLQQRSRLKEDAIIGLIFSSFFGIGLFMVSLNPTSVNIQTIILGNILAIAPEDIIQLAAIGFISMAILLLKWKDLMVTFFDEHHARSIGLNTRGLKLLFFTLLAACTVAALQTVGAFLVICLVVTPGAHRVAVNRSLPAPAGHRRGYRQPDQFLRRLAQLLSRRRHRRHYRGRANAAVPHHLYLRAEARPAGQPPPRQGGRMLNLFLAPFQFPFMVNAIAISIVVAIPCALLSVFLVLKGWALMGDAMSHAVFPGVVLAYIIGIPFAIGAFIAGLLCAVTTGFLDDNSRLKRDTIMGIVFSGMFGAGLVLYVAIQSDVHLDHILFGDMLGISLRDIGQTTAIALVIALIIGLKWRDFLLHAFDPTQAKASGLRGGLLHYGLLCMIALTIVATLQSVGIILSISLLIAPGAIALLLVRRFIHALLLAVAVAIGCSAGGVWLAFYLDSAPAPTIVVLFTALFVVAFVASTIRDSQKQKTSAIIPGGG